jgi:TnpA family transposase
VGDRASFAEALPARYGTAGGVSNLASVLTEAIDWDLIRQQYDQLVKEVTAQRLGAAAARSILGRFTHNDQHPTYRAFAELGKAVNTI